jgi:beta-lactamase regulating signal transducer with metallopeptidase domain
MGNGLLALAAELSGLGLTWLVQSSAVLVLGLLAGRMLRRSGPAVESGVYRTTLAAILICPVASVALNAAGFESLSLRLPAPAARVPAPQPVPPPEPAPIEPAAAASESIVDLRGGSHVDRPVPIALDHAEPSSGASLLPPETKTRQLTISPEAMAAIGLAVWLFGVMFLAMRMCVAQVRMRRLRASAVPAETGVDALCRNVARQMNLKSPSVWRTPFLFSPCLDGIRRPAILLPEDVGKNLRETFVHELAHLARRDGLWNLLRRCATAGLWLQPLVWLLSRRLEVAAEEVCDDYVVHFGAERAGYAGHLLELAGRALPPRAPAAVGMISLRSMLARRVVRILDTSRSLSTRVGKRAVMAMLTVGLLVTLLAGLIGVGGRPAAAARTMADAGDTTSDQAKNEKSIRGQVVGSDGKPVAGATVVTWRVRLAQNGIGDDATARTLTGLERQITGADGRYEFSFETPELAAAARLIATAPGFGLGHLHKEHQIRLTAGDLPIEGRLVDLEGRPIAGVKVSLGQVMLPLPRVAKEAAAPKNLGEPVTKMPASSAANAPPADPVSMAGRLFVDADALLPEGVVTDSDGRFRIAGLGRDVIAGLTLSGPAIALKQVRVITRSIDRIKETPRDPDFQGLDEPTIHGAKCTIAVAPTRPIEGFVRDSETREPIPGAIVTAASLSGSRLTIDGSISTETDAQGHFRLLGLPKEGAQGHKLAVYPPLDRPYFVTRGIGLPASPGFEPVKFNIALKRGIWITGAVTDMVTALPVVASIDYFPLLTNGHAKDYPNFDPNITASVAIKTRYKTDKEGRFRIVGLPGEGVVTAHTDDSSYRGAVGAESIEGRTGQDQLLTYDHIFPKLYQCLKAVSVPEAWATFTCMLKVDPGLSVFLDLVDESGSPVTNALVWGRSPEGSDNGDHNLYDTSVARIAGLKSGEPRTILIQERSRKLGAVVPLPPGPRRATTRMKVVLRPTGALKGRLVDSKGKPVTGGIRVALIASGASMFRQIPVASAELDSTGGFRCEDIPAGGPYEVEATNRLPYGLGRRMEPEQYQPFRLSQDLQLESAQTFDFGTVDVSTRKRVPDKTPRKSAAADVPITGRLIDLEGQPIANVSVKATSVHYPKSGDLTPWLEGVKKGEPPWVAASHIDHDRQVPKTATLEATTGKDGRFRLNGFGSECAVELELKGDAVAFAALEVATRKMDPVPARGFDNTYGPGFMTIFGADFTCTAAPGRVIEGTLKDSLSGQGLADAGVRSYAFSGTNYVGMMMLKTKTDSQGKFRLAGMPKGKGNKIIVVPNDEQPYLMQEVAVPDPPGTGAVKVDVALKRGIWIEGKITDKATGTALANARLHYIPFLENKFAQSHPVYHKSGNADGLGYQDRYHSKADGTFRLVGLPGRAIVGAIAGDGGPYLQGAGSEAIKGMNAAGHFETYNCPINPSKMWPTVMKEINPPGDASVVHVDFEVTTGPSVRLAVVDDAGQPIAGLKTNGRSGRSSYDREDTAKPEAEVTNLMPDEERIVLLKHEGRKLGKVVRVKKGDDAKGPVVAKLAALASITGRVVDADDNPIAGANVRPDVLPHGDFGLSLPQIITDADGRFRVTDVPTGCDYGLAIDNHANKGPRFTYRDKTTVKPGATTDVGVVKFDAN